MVYLSIGSNIGDRLQNLRNAVDRLKKAGFIIKDSPVFKTEPLGFISQPFFFNVVISFECSISPAELLKIIQQIELDLGRIREFTNSPRVIDLDIITFNELILDTAELKIPHPRYQERQFVLVPIAILDLDFVCPLTKKNIDKLLEDCPDNSNIQIVGNL